MFGLLNNRIFQYDDRTRVWKCIDIKRSNGKIIDIKNNKNKIITFQGSNYCYDISIKKYRELKMDDFILETKMNYNYDIIDNFYILKQNIKSKFLNNDNFDKFIEIWNVILGYSKERLFVTIYSRNIFGLLCKTLKSICQIINYKDNKYKIDRHINNLNFGIRLFKTDSNDVDILFILKNIYNDKSLQIVISNQINDFDCIEFKKYKKNSNFQKIKKYITPLKEIGIKTIQISEEFTDNIICLPKNYGSLIQLFIYECQRRFKRKKDCI